MYISIQELKLHRIDYDVSFAPGKIDFGSDIQQRGDLKSSGKAELLLEDRGGKNILEDIRLAGIYSTDVEMDCDRCLEPVQEHLSGTFDLVYRPQGSDGGRSEISISEADTEIGYYQNDGMLLEDILKEQVLLARPLKVVCNETCKGLCPHCRKNLNREVCKCTTDISDLRWTALAVLRDKLKQ